MHGSVSFSVMARQDSTSPGRGQGKRAGLDITQIIAAARSIGTADLTMQAVADALGVDRKTINHYVGDRRQLMRMAAISAFSESTAAWTIPDDACWQEACRLFATTVVDGLIAAGQFAAHVEADSELIAAIVEPAELLMERMAAAGFDDETSVRCLAQITNICLSFAGDAITRLRSQGTSRPELLRRGLELYRQKTGRGAEGHPRLDRIAQAGFDTYGREQFELTIETFIAGTDALAEGRRASPGPG